MVFYFSGTGNSRWVADRVSAELHESLLDIGVLPGKAIGGDLRSQTSGAPTECLRSGRRSGRATTRVAPTGCTIATAEQIFDLGEGEALGFVFPVHAWSPPKVVLEFIANLKLTGRISYLYYICTCGDDTGKTSRVFCKAVEKHGWTCSAGYSVFMPNTYVSLPGFDVDSKEIEEKKLREAVGRVDEIISYLKERRTKFDCHEGTMPWTKTYVLGPYFRKFLMDVRKFRTNGDCVGCGRCEKVCPLSNISMKDGLPTWGGRCAMCLACYHHCPHHALHYGKATEGKGQYFLS